MKNQTSRVECVDGYSISIQASQYNYCTPRQDEGPYSTYELGFPSEPDEIINHLAEDQGKPTETVYGYVPRKIIETLIEEHGGVANGVNWAQD